ncbi:hypothetical protein BDB01DRAFT_855369 [Pilobolus umbonatus]|nr:hypothetical protein BDB01DRAFT_855369 [Pilobolus umbonatus]
MWLSEVKAVVRKFVLPFFPAPSWTALTCPRKFGGVGLVDLIDQSHALYLIYIKRLLKPIEKADFLSPWLVYCFQHYTGHASILPWFMYPKVYSSLLSSCTSMSHLNKLLLRLPSLVPYDQWSGRWYLDLPLRSILNTTVSSPVLNPSNTPRRYLLSDLYKWDYSLGQLIPISAHRSILLRKIRSELLLSGNSTSPGLQLSLDLNRWLNIPPPPSSFNSDIADDILVFGVTSLLPNCPHNQE